MPGVISEDKLKPGLAEQHQQVHLFLSWNKFKGHRDFEVPERREKTVHSGWEKLRIREREFCSLVHFIAKFY